MAKKNKPKKKKDVYPLATNILKLQHYKIEEWGCEGVILFEWFIIKAKSFGFKEFYQSLRNIREETGIKRATAEKLIKQFVEIGFLTYETKGMPKVHHYIVDFSVLVKVTKLSLFYKKDYVREVLIWYKELEKQSRKSKKSVKKKKETEGSHPDLDILIDRLNSILNSRREMKNKKEREVALEEGRESIRILSETELSISLLNKLQLSLLLDNFKSDTIANSFIAYIDAVLNYDEEPINMMNHFLTYDESKGAWSVFDYYLNHFNNDYACSQILKVAYN